MKKTVITIIVFLILGVAAFFIWKSCSNKEEALDLDNYTPSKEFKAAADKCSISIRTKYTSIRYRRNCTYIEWFGGGSIAI